MYKLECREVGFDCSHTMTGNTEEEVLQKAKEHGTREHNLKESEIQSPDMQTKLRSLMHRTDQSGNKDKKEKFQRIGSLNNL